VLAVVPAVRGAAEAMVVGGQASVRSSPPPPICSSRCLDLDLRSESELYDLESG